MGTWCRSLPDRGCGNGSIWEDFPGNTQALLPGNCTPELVLVNGYSLSRKSGSRDPLLIVILGPTASGKTSLALALSPLLSGEIINGDAMQMVRHLNIGTAKPSTEERALVPHHLYDFVQPDEFFSAGQYMTEARKICHEVAGRGSTPIVVGGSGLYLRVLLEGIFPGPGRASSLRSRLQRIAEKRGVQTLLRMLRRHDPEAADRIQPGDLVRLVRALEVRLLTGIPITRLQASADPIGGFRVLKIGLDVPREKLYGRINRRVTVMFTSGLLGEVESVLDMGYSIESKGFEAIGYRQAMAVLSGELSVEEAISLTQRDTRRYAKRQMTWFRKEKDVHWLPFSGDEPQALRRVLSLLKIQED